ncbi:hypothetical protein CPB86DRAFT_420460 [Serendipita vermifera]|nr:hypothetical protein CPB86DRAFT_420460 [Serendipita vermifera]
MCVGSGCGNTTLYGSSTVTTSVPTTYTTTSFKPPFASTFVVNYTYCVSSSGSQCLSSTTSRVTGIADYFFGLNITTTVTTTIPRTTTAVFPTATSTIPCTSKRSIEEIEGLEKRGEAGPSLKMSSKAGIAVLGAVFASMCLL